MIYKGKFTRGSLGKICLPNRKKREHIEEALSPPPFFSLLEMSP
jgi:hypothetical protein